MFIIILRATTKTDKSNKTIQRAIVKTQKIKENRILKKCSDITKGGRKEETTKQKTDNNRDKI